MSLGGKSSVLMDIKPWDDETDMKKLEEAVRSVELPGLFWGACMISYVINYFLSFSFICVLLFVDLIYIEFFCAEALVIFLYAAKLMPVGYGIKKLHIMLTIVDDLVSVDDLIEDRLTAEPINEYVQSCDIVAFNKI